jgi:hypothetical protein
MVAHLGQNDIDLLIRELKPDFGNIDKTRLSKELGVEETSKRFEEGIKRTVIIFAVSVIL